MKKSKIKLLTATACLALVGTASAAWVYAGTATASANIGVKVASYASAGTITINNASNLYVYLDKGSVAFKKDDSTIPFSATYTKPDNLELDTTQELKLTYRVTINSGITYITFGSSVTDRTGEGTGEAMKAYSGWRTWESDKELFDNLPELTWLPTSTIDSDLADESKYKSFIEKLTESTLDDDDWDQNKTWSATSKFDLTIEFKAEVVSKS